MEDKLNDVDELLIDLIDLAREHMENCKSKKFFSKDLVEACGIIISLAYGRFSNNDK